MNILRMGGSPPPGPKWPKPSEPKPEPKPEPDPKKDGGRGEIQ